MPTIKLTVEELGDILKISKNNIALPPMPLTTYWQIIEQLLDTMRENERLREALIQILDDGQFIEDYEEDETPIFTKDKDCLIKKRREFLRSRWKLCRLRDQKPSSSSSILE